MKQIKKAEQLKQHGKYLLSNGFVAYSFRFLEVAYPAAKEGEDILMPQEMPSAQFIGQGFPDSWLYARDRESLFKKISKQGIKVYEL